MPSDDRVRDSQHLLTCTQQQEEDMRRKEKEGILKNIKVPFIFSLLSLFSHHHLQTDKHKLMAIQFDPLN